jgi:hypothetical protein
VVVLIQLHKAVLLELTQVQVVALQGIKQPLVELVAREL